MEPRQNTNNHDRAANASYASRARQLAGFRRGVRGMQRYAGYAARALVTTTYSLPLLVAQVAQACRFDSIRFNGSVLGPFGLH